MSSLDDCSKEEVRILAAILATFQGLLPRPLTDYTAALGELSRTYFDLPGGPRGDHNPSPGSVAIVRRRK